MKIGIIYESKGETTKRCAKYLAKKLKVDPIVVVDTLNLKTQGTNINISKYDIVILGSGIRFGKVYKNYANFIKKNKQKLLKGNVAYFICCGFTKQKSEYFNENINSKLLNNAIYYDSFGGELNTKDTKGINKFIIASLKKQFESNNKKIELNDENIDKFIAKIKENLE